jgi:hypothetical protein
MFEMRNAYKILIGGSEGKISLGRPRRKWEDNIKMNFKEAGCEALDCIHVILDIVSLRCLVNAVMNLHSSIKRGNFVDQMR